jgi:hypothetical protein
MHCKSVQNTDLHIIMKHRDFFFVNQVFNFFYHVSSNQVSITQGKLLYSLLWQFCSNHGSRFSLRNASFSFFFFK